MIRYLISQECGVEAPEDFLPRRLLVMMQPLASTPSYCNIVFYLVPVLIVFLSDTELLYNLVSLHLLEEDICQQTVASLGIVLMVSRYPDFTCSNLKNVVLHWIYCGWHVGHLMMLLTSSARWLCTTHTHMIQKALAALQFGDIAPRTVPKSGQWRILWRS